MIMIFIIIIRFTICMHESKRDNTTNKQNTANCPSCNLQPLRFLLLGGKLFARLIHLHQLLVVGKLRDGLFGHNIWGLNRRFMGGRWYRKTLLLSILIVDGQQIGDANDACGAILVVEVLVLDSVSVIFSTLARMVLPSFFTRTSCAKQMPVSIIAANNNSNLFID